MPLRNEFQGDIMGVPVRFANVIEWAGNGHSAAPRLIANQRAITGKRAVPNSDGETIRAELRFDDSCKNGHMSFELTATIYDKRGRDIAGGCCHEEIARAFPELAPLIQWHLFDTSGPLHYVANTVFHAGNRDCWGREPGQPSRFEYGVRFGQVPLFNVLPQTYLALIQSES